MEGRQLLERELDRVHAAAGEKLPEAKPEKPERLITSCANDRLITDEPLYR